MSKTFVIGRGGSDAAPSSNKASYNTVSRAPQVRPGRNFHTKVMFFFALVAILTAIVMTVVLAFVWEGRFQEYSHENMQRMADTTAESLSNAYQNEGEWTESVLARARLATNASPDLIVQVLDASGKVIYDDTWTVERQRMDTRDNRTLGVMLPIGLELDDEDGDMVTADVIDENNVRVGVVIFRPFGSKALITKSDAAFRSSTYEALATAAVVAIVLAVIMGWFASRYLSRPIRKITTTAAQIRGGDLTARTNVSGVDDIGRLGETFDSMATTLERDIAFEHRLTSDVAHELRTPLMAMLVTVEAMQDGVLPADDEHFETVAAEIRRLSRLVDAMLHLSRIENGKREGKFESTDLVNLVRSLVSVEHQLFHERGLHLRFDDKTPRHECFAEVDPDLIREAITNIMSNAMRYTSQGGWVVASVGCDRKEAIISVSDTGIGIAEEDIPRVFARFWRSDVSRERVSGGLGVGLAITKEIVDQHYGTIGVESEVGKGTTFRITLPLTHRVLDKDEG